jgi:hypothetical protein
VIEPHHLYEQLGLSVDARQLAYRELFRFELNIAWWMKYARQRTKY